MSIFSTMLELHLLGLKSILFYPEDQKMFLCGFFFQKNRWGKGRYFEKNHGLTPLQNVDFFDFLRTSLFRSKKHSFLSRRSKNVSFWLFFAQKKHMRKRSIFLQKPWTNPFAKCQYFLTLLELHFSGLKSIVFYPEYQKMFLSGFFLLKKDIGEKFIFWQKKPWTNPFQNYRFFDLL